MQKTSLNRLSSKIQTVLYIVLTALILIGVRAWHLSVVEHDNKVEESRRPQKRIIVEPAKRGTIRDRFNIPLAINKIQYQATIIYSQILQIPSVHWEKLQDGSRIKRFKRRNYIKQLSEMLAEELRLDADRLEDLIHSKAALYHQLPFLIKDNLTEKEYYRLKHLEKDWIGLSVKRLPCRYYPQGRVAADIIGYLGAINKNEYESILSEIRGLEEYVQLHDQGEDPPMPAGISSVEEAWTRLLDLTEKAYTLSDSVGKMGIEGKYEQMLRGCHGSHSYLTDARGNFTRELPGTREPSPGRRVLLTLSAELQSYAEELLIANEQMRQARITISGSLDKSVVAPKQPWIKGGAIIALEPKTGEILAMASYPRYDPNDFAATDKRRKNIKRWFEMESYLADIWEQRQPLQREVYDRLTGGVYEEEAWLTWDAFLNFILPLEGPLRQAVEKAATIKDAIKIQRGDSLEKYQEGLETEYDKTLLVDLCRLAVWDEAFDDELIEAAGRLTLAEHHEHCSAYARLKDNLKQVCHEQFRIRNFIPWRKQNEKQYLKEKREEEKKLKKYPKPYIDLLDAEEKSQFEAFWESNFHDFIAAFLIGSWGAVEPESSLENYLEYFRDLGQSTPLDPAILQLQKSLQIFSSPQAYAYLVTLRTFRDLNRPLLGKYRQLRREGGKQTERQLAMGFYPLYGYGYGRSYAYRQSTTQGSIFKLVTAYAALIQQYNKDPEGDLNPLLIYDSWQKRGNQTIVGMTEEQQPIPQLYKGGRLPKSLSRNIGWIDISKALIYSSNPYFSLLAGDVLGSPEDLGEAARLFSYGSPTGVELPGEIGGHIPDDLSANRTGLYAMAIGQHTLVVTPIQAAVMLAAIANGGKVFQPKIVRLLAGRGPLRTTSVDSSASYPFQDSLNFAGLDFPLFSALARRDSQHIIDEQPSRTKHEVSMPIPIQKILLESMKQVVLRGREASLKYLRKLYRKFPQAIKDYDALADQLIGKTSTAESVEAVDLEIPPKSRIYNHLWFGGILLDPSEKTFLFQDSLGNSDLVVVVYLRYGGYGKDTMPLAAQVAQRWRQIKARHAEVRSIEER